MKKFKFLSVCFVVCALAAAFAIVPGAFAEDASADAPVAVTLNGALAEDLSFSKDEKVTLDAQTDLEGRIRWQYLADEAENLWVSVYGENSASFTLTYAKVFNMLNDENTAQIRCAVGEVFSNPVTVTLKEQSAPIAKAMNASPFGLTRAAEEEGTAEGEISTYSITINYVDEEDQVLADPFEYSDLDANTVVHLAVESPVISNMVISKCDPESLNMNGYLLSGVFQMLGDQFFQVLYKADSESGSGSGGESDTGAGGDAGAVDENTCFVTLNYKTDDGTIVAGSDTFSFPVGYNFTKSYKLPEVPGYLPYVWSADAGEYIQANEIQLVYYFYTPQNIELDIIYRGTNVPYTVNYFKQHISDDGYDKSETRTYTGITNTTVSKTNIESVEYEGFTRLLYSDDVTIAADGSTALDVYFDRNYYLMMFDLDGGYGVDPIYARYETPISVGTPSKTGYAFAGWDDLSTENVETLSSPEIRSTMPAKNVQYKAQWTPAEVKFTVAYWLQNPDNPDQYDYWYSTQYDGIAEEEITAEKLASYEEVDSEHRDTDDRYYAEFKEVTCKDSSLAADGSTVINVRYDRKEYTLKFYYAMSSGSGSSIKYYVVGGTTYRFGATAYISDENKSNVIKLLDQYTVANNSYSLWNQCGRVDELPSLNAEGVKRGYTLGSETSDATTGLNTGFTYYYFSFKAKYGADISEKWPCNVINSVTRLNKPSSPANKWTGTEAFVSAWNGEHHVLYSQRHSGAAGTVDDNQTIKGNYNQLDKQLLWDKQFGDSETVSYLCFWENGADGPDWNIPRLFRYKIYVPVLDGQNTKGLDLKTDDDGVTYYRRNLYDTCDNSTAAEQTAPAITGFTYKTYKDSTITDFDSDLYKSATEVNFFYERNVYTLTFKSGDVITKRESIPYETDLSEGAKYTAIYPENLEAGAYKFAGWYTTENFIPGTEFSFTDAAMPAHDIMLYAKWVPTSHTVEVYKDNTLSELLETYTVPHGKQVENPPAEPTNGNYTFVYWFYDDNGVEKAFDFSSMPVRKDLKIYAKWSSNVLRPYIVRYKIQGTDISIGESDVFVADVDRGSALVNSTKTFYAKGGTDLYEAYQTKYFPIYQSHSFTIAMEGENTYDFEYIKKDTVPYKVYYKIVDENGDVVGPAFYEADGITEFVKTVDNNQYAIVTERYKPLVGYIPDSFQKSLIVTVDENGNPKDEENVITFYYTKDELHALWNQTHYTENLDGTSYSVYRSYENTGDIDTEYTADLLDIDGFSFDDTNTDNVISGTLTSNGLDLKRYYKRNEYPYKVQYLEQGTNNVLYPEKTGKAKYEATLTENAVDIFGYSLVNSTPQYRTIQIETGTDAEKNVITFLYKEDNATYTYTVVGPDGCGSVSYNSETVNVITGNAQGSTATANTGYRFVGWYSDQACTDLVSSSASYVPEKTTDSNGTYYTGGQYYAKFEPDVASLTITKAAATGTTFGSKETFVFRIVGDQTNDLTKNIDLTVTIRGAGSIVINDLPVGKYTVTEETAWSSRYTPDGNNPREVQLVAPANITEALENTVTFTNTMNKKQWLDGNGYTENVFRTVTAAPEAGN